MIKTMTYEFDEQNQVDYEENTKKISEALDKIENDATLSATLAELSRQTGLHRNTLRDRSLIVGDLAISTTVSDELSRIKLAKKIKKEQKKQKTKDAVKELEDQVENAKRELVAWFTKFRNLSEEFSQLEIQLNRKDDLVGWYKKELDKERGKVTSLQERINVLEDLLK